MVREIDGKWGYSLNEEDYYEFCDTPDQAKDEAMKEAIAKEFNTEQHVWIGQYQKVRDPESFIDADRIIEHSAEQDDYSGDWGADWPNDTPEQRQELADAVGRVYGEWLDKYDLRPNWGLIQPDTVQKFRVGDLLPKHQ